MLATVKQCGGTVTVGARADRPIENCELCPNAFVQIKGGVIDNPTKSRLLDVSNFYFTFTWRRSSNKTACCHPGCPRNDSFEPMKWSKAILGGPELTCNVCTNAGIPVHESSFCSKA